MSDVYSQNSDQWAAHESCSTEAKSRKHKLSEGEVSRSPVLLHPLQGQLSHSRETLREEPAHNRCSVLAHLSSVPALQLRSSASIIKLANAVCSREDPFGFQLADCTSCTDREGVCHGF